MIRRRRLGVRGLLAAVAAIGLGLGGWCDGARRNGRAYRTCREAGLNAIYRSQLRPPAEGPAWSGGLDRVLGPAYWDEIVQVGEIGCVMFGDVEPIDPAAPRPADDAVLEQVGHLGALENLDLSGRAGITRAGLRHVRGLARLEHLDLRRAEIEGGDLALFAGMARLRSLALGAVEGADLAPLAGLRRLGWLEIGRVTRPDLAALAGLPALTEVRLGRSGLADADLAYLAGLPALVELEAGGRGIADLGRIAAGMPRLRTLLLWGTSVDDLAPLARLGSLWQLGLAGAPIDDDDLAALAGLAGLRTLDLSGTRVTDRGLAHLAGLAYLRTLDLSGTGVRGPGLAALAGLARLRSLKLDGCPLADAEIGALDQLGGLSDLSLDRTPIADAGLARLPNPGRIGRLRAEGARAAIRAAR